MIPSGLKSVHFKKAAAEIDKDNVPPERLSVHYDLLLDGKRYPPKYVISLAQKYATGEPYPAREFNAVQARDYFRGLGYTVLDRREEALAKIAPEDEESSFPEGAAIYKLHKMLERDRGITRKAKAQRFAETGKLECEICKFNFAVIYGSIGEGFIEAHHKTPVSTIDAKTKTKISDLAMVCSNCHRMLHSRKSLLGVEDLRKQIFEART
jgi:HNH endonuclease